MRVTDSQVLDVSNSKDIVLARKHIVSTAKSIGMNQMKESDLRTAATELMTNMIRHAGGGKVTVERVEHERLQGVRASFEDNGPGIPDVEAALSKGFSTKGSLGHGLSGCPNLVDSFDLKTNPGRGTRVVITKWS